MPGDPDSPRAAGEAHQAARLAPVARLARQTVTRLRSALVAADYDVDAVISRLGNPAHSALARNHTVLGLAELADSDDAQATLIRLWPLQATVSRRAADAALPHLVDELCAAGILASNEKSVRALVDIRPYGSDDGLRGWVVSDLTPGMDGRIDLVADDYVLGVSPASSTLTQMSARTPVGLALDLGTGCGVQSLHLAGHAHKIIATDVNERALCLAELTFALSEVDSVEMRTGSLYEPVRELRFDQIVSNPPYVMAPPQSAHLTYREQGMPGDALVAEVVRGAAQRLNDGGSAQILANWAHPTHGDWAERLATWVAGTGCDLHVVEREVLDPAEYVELWLTDAGLTASASYRDAYVSWLRHLADSEIAAVGMGWIFLSQQQKTTPSVVVEQWPHPVQQPVGIDVALWPQRSRLAERDEAELLATRFVVAPDVVQKTVGRPGAEDPQHIVLEQREGMGRSMQCTTALAGVVGACDGDLSLDVIVSAVAQLLDQPAAELHAEVIPAVRELARHGMVTELRPGGTLAEVGA